MLALLLLACGANVDCDGEVAGPEEIVDAVLAARTDLAAAGTELCVTEVSVGDRSHWSKGRLTVRADHVRADVFEAACQQILDTDGLPAGADELFTANGLPPGGDLSLSVARACGREAEEQSGSFAAAFTECGGEGPSPQQQLVLELVGRRAFLPEGDIRWETVLEVSRTDESVGNFVVSDRHVAAETRTEATATSGPIQRLAMWSLDGQRLADRDLPFETAYSGDLVGVRSGVLGVDDDGAVWGLSENRTEAFAPIPDRGRVVQDQFGWWVWARSERGGTVYAYDPLEGLGDVVRRGVEAVWADHSGVWLRNNGETQRMDGSRLAAPLNTGGTQSQVIHEERVWAANQASYGSELILSRSVSEPEPWRLESNTCSAAFLVWIPGGQSLYRLRISEDNQTQFIERMVPSAAP